MKYLDKQGWGDSGSWAMVTDEPTWGNNATLTNSIALMKLQLLRPMEMPKSIDY